MSVSQTQDRSLLSLDMMAVMAAQFFSALADNAVLIIAIAIVKARGAEHLVPLLQEAFVAPFILLAPFAGEIADGFPKGRVMLVANLLKVAGALAMALGLNPLFAYNLIGVGATVYSPAKYGILSQMFGPARLVRANGMLEGSTIAAILLGVLVGGWLADHSLSLAFGGVVGAYLLAAGANLLIPRLPAESPLESFRPGALLRQFLTSAKTLLANPDARFSILASSMFWGSGTTLRLMLFAWVPVALAAHDNQTPANLMGVVSIGIVLGAAAAGLWISLAKVNRALIGGVLIGPAILALTQIGDMGSAIVVMAAIGFFGGLFVVPLNALLQERGHDTIGAGKALAVQNFAENSTMLLFVGAYSLTTSAGVGVIHSIGGFGLVLFLVLATLASVRVWGTRLA
jgi:MFS transporter, LPLT family, lysophospholipid transporter